MRSAWIAVGAGLAIASNAAGQAGVAGEVVSLLGGRVKLLGASDEQGTSQAVVVDSLPLAYTAQVLPLQPNGTLAAQGSAGGQTAAAIANLDKLLERSGMSLEQVLKLNVYVARESDLASVRRAVATAFHRRMKPAVSVVVTSLPHPGALVAVDAVAASREDAAPQPNAPPRVTVRGPAPGLGVLGSSALAVMPVGGQIYISGQAEMADDLKAATRKTLESLQATLKHLGRSTADVVQYRAFVKPMSSHQEVYQVFGDVLGKDRLPPLVLVEWESTLPTEIELVAWGGPSDGTRGVQYVTPPGMIASPLFTAVVRSQRPQTIYIGGLYGTNAASSTAQITEIFETLRRVARAGGSDMKHLLKATYCVSDEGTGQKLNELRPRYFDPARPPAASKVMVRGVGWPGKSISVDMIAAPAK